ncbi:MAG: pilus assembly protein PilM [Alphaproteobacteria bacterium]|nr:pilus assembly protein PilM [Alphaproteobacteria bacterium]
MPLLIGVDLGSHAVKVTTYRSAGRRVELEHRFSYPVPQSGGVPPLAARLAALEALLDENPGWTSATVGLVLPGEEASFRPMSMPFTDRAQVEKTLPFAIEGEVPYDLDDMVLGWRSARDGDKSRVMAILTRRDVLQRYLAAMKERGVDPRVVVPDGELLGAYATSGTVAVVDIGHTHTMVSVVQDGEVRATRAVNVGGWNFTRAIQGALGCEWGEAEALKHGAVHDDDATESLEARSGYATLAPAAKAAMDGAVGQLLAEIRSTLIRFEDEIELDIEEIRVSGGSARIPELLEYLSGDLGLPVTPVSDDDGAIPPAFATSHAIARYVSGLSEAPAVDLRVGELSFTGGVNTLRAVLTYGTAGAAFFAVAAVAIFAFQYVSLLGELSEVNGRITSVVTETFPQVPADMADSGTKAVAVMTEFTGDTVSRSELLPPANPGEPRTVARLYELTNAFPPHAEVEIELTSLEVLPTLIVFEGETAGFAESAKIEESLQGHAKFKSANKDSENRTTAGKVKFKFSIPLDGSGETDEEAG